MSKENSIDVSDNKLDYLQLFNSDQAPCIAASADTTGDVVTTNTSVTTSQIKEKICIHTYLTKCKTVKQPPGFADFIRGTIALYNISKEYGYKLYIDNSHPLFKYIKDNENIISRNLSLNILELYPENGLNYENIYYNLQCNFAAKKSFVITTNSFYTINNNIDKKNNNDAILNWGSISDDCRIFLKDIFRPTLEVENKIEYIFNSVYNIKRDNYAVIHLRFGDKCLNNNEFDVIVYQNCFFTINNLLVKNPNKNIKYILISDSSIIAKKLHVCIKDLYYWENNKVHLGELYNNSDSAILDTLVDFFIMSGSKYIISNGSGFSKVVSLIYDIQYYTI